MLEEKKTYDLKKLGEKLKDKGLDIAEDSLALVVEETFDWVAESAVASENKYDDLLVGVIPAAKKVILAQVDKLDKEDDEGR